MILVRRSCRVPVLVTSLWLATAVAMLGATPALASHEPPRLGLTPVDDDGQYYDLTLDPGESVELAVEITNVGHESVLARTYVADAYSLIKAASAPSFTARRRLGQAGGSDSRRVS